MIYHFTIQVPSAVIYAVPAQLIAENPLFEAAMFQTRYGHNEIIIVMELLHPLLGDSLVESVMSVIEKVVPGGKTEVVVLKSADLETSDLAIRNHENLVETRKAVLDMAYTMAEMAKIVGANHAFLATIVGAMSGDEMEVDEIKPKGLIN